MQIQYELLRTTSKWIFESYIWYSRQIKNSWKISPYKVILSKRQDGLNVIHRWEMVKKEGGGKKVFLGICSIRWREEDGKISCWNCLSYTRHVTYLNLIGQTNASIESVPGTSQPQWNITCASRHDINYIISRHNVRFFWSEIWSGFGEPGSTPPPRIPTSNPPQPWTDTPFPFCIPSIDKW